MQVISTKRCRSKRQINKQANSVVLHSFPMYLCFDIERVQLTSYFLGYIAHTLN